MFGGIGVQELLVIFLIVLLLFGAKRIPEIAQGLGKGIREFKKSMKEATDEVTKPTEIERQTKTNNDSSKKE